MVKRISVAATLILLAVSGCGSRVELHTQALQHVQAPTALPSSASPSAAPTASPSPLVASPGGIPTHAPATLRPTPSPSPTPASWPTLTSPGARVSPALLPTRTGLLLYGGNAPANGPALTDTWLWNGRQWHQISRTGPVANYQPALGSDPRTGQPLLLAGGDLSHEGSSANAYGDETWTWNGHGWTHLHPQHALVSGTVMSTVLDHGRLLAWVSTSSGDMSQGGLANQTASSQMWAWDGTDWTRLYAHSASAHGPGDPQVVVPGPGHSILGVGQGSYRWTGTGWQQLSNTGGPTDVTSAAYDPTRHLVVAAGLTSTQMIADQGVHDDGTYLFDGSHWTKTSLPQALSGRAGPVMSWDPTDQAVLFGLGQESVGFTARIPHGYRDTWLFTPAGWTQRTR